MTTTTAPHVVLSPPRAAVVRETPYTRPTAAPFPFVWAVFATVAVSFLLPFFV